MCKACNHRVTVGKRGGKVGGRRTRYNDVPIWKSLKPLFCTLNKILIENNVEMAREMAQQ